jgi:hypothetical protein
VARAYELDAPAGDVEDWPAELGSPR